LQFIGKIVYISICLKGVTLAKKSKKDENVEAYRYETGTRKNVVPVGLASYDTSTPKPRHKKYECVKTVSKKL
jgi:hypothetical protein